MSHTESQIDCPVTKDLQETNQLQNNTVLIKTELSIKLFHTH